MSKTFRFTAETNLQEALDLDPRVQEAFRRLGLKCNDCVAAIAEDFRVAALYHTKSLDEILAALNALGIQDRTENEPK